MKEFKKELFGIALEKARVRRYQERLQNTPKQEETKGYTKKVRFESFRMIEEQTMVKKATIRNCFAGTHNISINSMLSLCEWANLDINDFYK